MVAYTSFLNIPAMSLTMSIYLFLDTSHSPLHRSLTHPLDILPYPSQHQFICPKHPCSAPSVNRTSPGCFSRAPGDVNICISVLGMPCIHHFIGRSHVPQIFLPCNVNISVAECIIFSAPSVAHTSLGCSRMPLVMSI